MPVVHDEQKVHQVQKEAKLRSLNDEEKELNAEERDAREKYQQKDKNKQQAKSAEPASSSDKNKDITDDMADDDDSDKDKGPHLDIFV